MPEHAYCEKCQSNDIEHINTDYHFGYVCMNCGHQYRNFSQTDCCKNPDKVNIRFEQANGTIVQRLACVNCKTMIGGAIKKDENFNTYKLLTQKRYNEVFEEKQSDSRIFLSRSWELFEKFKKKSHQNWLNKHGDYLNSPEWKSLRKKVLERDNYICQGCLIEKATQVHHKTYQHWKNEPAFELVSLCNSCHDKIHSNPSLVTNEPVILPF